MKTINNFYLENIEKFKLYIGILNNERKFSIVGILIKDDKVLEYCETNEIKSYDDAIKIFNTLKENKVFPCHFYNIIDDMLL